MSLHDPCIQINITNQCHATIMFHVDAFLMARTHLQVLTVHVIFLDSHYSAKHPLVVMRVKLCEFLGMMIDFAVMKKSCTTAQYSFINDFHAQLPDELKMHCRSVLAPSFFKVDRNVEPICKEFQEERHEETEKILWLGQRSRTSAQLSTSFIALE